jgi:hypothetical protein
MIRHENWLGRLYLPTTAAASSSVATTTAVTATLVAVSPAACQQYQSVSIRTAEVKGVRLCRTVLEVFHEFIIIILNSIPLVRS